ncbi:MAG: DUF4382 domain-containing protein [Bacteroidetes bacterium]|nr:DUF4382 domain-containing protein [Bacteroidota bacterium]
MLVASLFTFSVVGSVDATHFPGVLKSITLRLIQVDIVHTTDLATKGEVITVHEFSPPIEIELLALQSGILSALAITDLPDGFVTQIRLVTTDAAITFNGKVFSLSIPGGVVKFNGVLIVPDDGNAVFEFDAEKSVISIRNQVFKLKPSFKFFPIGLAQFNDPKSPTSILGDKDGFGLGLKEGDIRPVSLGFFDNREIDDPLFTDVEPVPTVGTFPSLSFSYTHTFAVPPEGIIRANLRMLTTGIQDGDTQVFGSDTDLRLFLDGVEVPGAFDDVDQFDFFAGVGFAEIVGLVSIEIPGGLLPLLSDGEVVVRIEINQLGTAPSFDAFAIDFSELQPSTSFGCGDTGLSLYQSFTTTASSLLAVEPRFRTGEDFPTAGVDTTVKIRTDSPTGTVLGTAMASIPGPQLAGAQLLVRFNFSPAITVTPGDTFVIEWVSPASAGEDADTILTWMGRTDNPYGQGNMFGCTGTPVLDNDLNFRTFSQ